MRIKIQFKNAASPQKNSFLLTIPQNISTFHDLHQYILEKFSLKNKRLQFSLHENFTILLSDKINEVILNENIDILNVEILNFNKRTNQELVSEEYETNDKILKKVKNCDFCSFLENCMKIKNIINPMKNQEFLANYFEEHICLDPTKPLNKTQSNEIPKETIKIIANPEKSTIISNKNDKNKLLNKELKKPMELDKIQNNKTISKGFQKQQSSSESSESSEEDKNYNRTKALKPENKIENIPKKVILSKSSDLISEDPQIKEIKKSNIPSIILKNAADNNKALNILAPEEEFARKKAQWKMLPPPLKSANPKEIFKLIPNEFLLNYEEKHDKKKFFQPNDLLRFKTYELCPIKLSPVLSEPRKGVLLKIDENTNILQIKLKTGETIENDVKSLLGLELEITNLDEERKNELTLYEQSKKIENPKENIVKTNNFNKNVKKEYSKEDYIAKQVNFYFSDKNYTRDDFIQAHIKKNEEKYFPTRLLLNFPKIKQVTQDFDWLLGVLKDFRAKNIDTCNFEFGNTDESLRKKNDP